MQVLIPLSEPLTEQQRFDTYGLEKSCRQAEDALSQGMEKLQQMLADSVGPGHLVEGTHIPQMDTAMERLEALVSFVNQVMYASLYSHPFPHQFSNFSFQSKMPCLLFSKFNDFYTISHTDITFNKIMIQFNELIICDSLWLDNNIKVKYIDFLFL